MVSSYAYDLLWGHFPIAHSPFFYDAKSGRFDLSNSVIGGYRDAIALVDHTLGQPRTAMERRAAWDSTAVIIMADHSLRG